MLQKGLIDVSQIRKGSKRIMGESKEHDETLKRNLLCNNIFLYNNMEEAEDEKFYKTDAKTATAGSLLIYKSFFKFPLKLQCTFLITLT